MAPFHPRSRREVLSSLGWTAAAAPVAACLPAALSGPESEQVLRFASWKRVELPGRPERFREFFMVASNTGAVGYCRTLDQASDLDEAVQAISGLNLLNHDALYDRMVERNVPAPQIKIMDIACWDMHARMRGQPFHVLLGSRKNRILRYGDVRGQQPGFSPRKYAGDVAAYFDRTGLNATKLHFPGAMATSESLSLTEIMETLTAVRQAVGDKKILAWDPYPRSAESATPSVDEALRMIRHMDELNYAWFEGPLPPVPYESQISKYARLMQSKPRLRIQAEGPGSPIGDGSSFSDMLRWVEAGAINQCSTDAYLRGGITNALRMMQYAKGHPERGLVINLHWSWAPHAHLVMAFDDAVCPIAEFPMTKDIPESYLDGPYLRAPDWPGVYRID